MVGTVSLPHESGQVCDYFNQQTVLEVILCDLCGQARKHCYSNLVLLGQHSLWQKRAAMKVYLL